MALFIGLVAFIGAMLTVYLLHIEAKLSVNKNYKAICDISDKISCTAASRSRFSHLLGISNAVLGILYYGLVAILALFDDTTKIFYVSVPAMIMTVYLAYLMLYKLKKICLVCSAAYIINALIFILSLTS